MNDASPNYAFERTVKPQCMRQRVAAQRER